MEGGVSVFQISELDIVDLIKGTNLDYIIELKNGVKYTNLNIADTKAKELESELENTKEFRNQCTI